MAPAARSGTDACTDWAAAVRHQSADSPGMTWHAWSSLLCEGTVTVGFVLVVWSTDGQLPAHIAAKCGREPP